MDFLKADGAGIADILGKMTSVGGTIQDQVQAPLNGVVGEVTGGIWTGDGANAFLDEVAQNAIPYAQKVFDTIGEIEKKMQDAQELINVADSLLNGEVGNFVGDFVESIGISW